MFNAIVPQILKKLAARTKFLAAAAAFAASLIGCSGSSPSEFSTKDLPPEMKTKPGEEVAPSGNTFRNPRDQAGRAPARGGG